MLKQLEVNKFLKDRDWERTKNKLDNRTAYKKDDFIIYIGTFGEIKLIKRVLEIVEGTEFIIQKVKFDLTLMSIKELNGLLKLSER